VLLLSNKINKIRNISLLFGREINLPIELVLGRPGYNEYSHELKTVYADEISEKLEKICQK
jgi:hypothetical protein